MCFSVNVNLIKEELEEKYGADFPDKYRYQPSYYYHAFSLPEMPSICSEEPGKIDLLRWGLIPSWVKNPADANDIRYKTFNARAETLKTKPSFFGSLRTRRCIIPVKGFFEWQHLGKVKVPWYIHKSDNDILSLAGLYSEWVNSDTGELIRTFTVITTEANEMMSVIHNSKKRMPAFLEKGGETVWTDLNVKPDEALELLRPCPEDYLEAYTVGPLVSSRSADKNSPDVIRPLNLNPQKELF